MTVALPPSMDFETYSEAGFILEPGGKVYSAAKSGKGGLPAVGTPVYASHPSTDILCLYYDLRDGRGRQGWMPGMPSPYELLEYVASGGPIEAFNITFEWWIWNMVAVRRYGWPPLQLDQCHCVMAKCRRYSLPGALGNVTKVMGTAPKDKEGGRLIQKLTRPHTPTKNRPAVRWTTATAWEDFQALYKYCDGDVLAEDEVSERVPDLSAHERDIWLADQYINARGVQVDTVTLEAALSILAQAEAKYNAELAELTGGAVLAATELGKLQEWLADQGVNMPNMQKQTIDDTVSTGSAWLPGPALRALEIRQLLGSANIKKLHSLKLQTNHDGRLRGQYMYCGADRSGRWSSSGVQLQNLTGKGPDAWRCSECGEVSGRNEGECRRCGQWAGLMERTDGWTIEGTEAAIEDIRTGDLATVERMWGGDPLTVLCGVLRGLLTAKPGHELICVDFSAIEAVVAACIARCQWRIDVFNTPGSDIYLESISRIKGQQTTDSTDRAIGKVAELSSGYGGWIGAWVAFGAEKYMDEAEIKAAILAWREASPEIVEAWGGQYVHCGPGKWDYRPELFGFEGMAISAILQPGLVFRYTDIEFFVEGDILHVRLPSGRDLHYHQPRLSIVRDRLNRGDCYQITFMGYNSNAMKGPIGWHRLETFGGRLFENGSQAIARDLQADAMVRCERRGYPVVMHLHDEIIAEVPIGQGSLAEMTEIMIERPAWASWWPIRGAGWRGERYRKD